MPGLKRSSRAKKSAPVDVIQIILDVALRRLDGLQHINERTALLDAVSKVSRSWRAAAQPRLFEFVTIRSQDGLHCLVDPRAGGQWTHRTRYLRVDFFWKGQAFAVGNHRLSYQHQPKLAVLLNRLVGIRHLSINGMRAKVMVHSLIDSISGLPHMETFELDCHGRSHQLDPLINSMATWPRITTLKLSNIACTPIKIHTSYLHPQYLSSLRRLELYSLEIDKPSLHRLICRLPSPALTHLALALDPALLPIISQCAPRLGSAKLASLHIDAGPDGFAPSHLIHLLSRCPALRALEINDRNITNFPQFLSILPRGLSKLYVSANCLELRGARKALPPPSAIFTAFNERHVERGLGDLMLVPNLTRLVLDPIGWRERVKTKMLKDVDVVGILEAACDRRAIRLEWKEWGVRAGFGV